MRRKRKTTRAAVTVETRDKVQRLIERWDALDGVAVIEAIVNVAYQFETFEEFEAVRPWAALGEGPGKES